MNEEAFQDLYEEFVNTGYRGTKADFKVLMQENREAFLDGYKSFTSTGYNGSEQDFATLIGVNVPVKKKDFQENMDGSGEDSSLESSTLDPSQLDFTFDVNQVRGQDTRGKDYRNPMDNIGMYPDAQTLERARAQQKADFDYTMQLERQELAEDAPFLKARQNTERLAESQRQDLDQSLALGIQADEDFINSLSTIDGNLIDKEEEEVVPFLREQFSKYGFIFEETGIGDAMIVTSPDGSRSIEIDLDPFKSKTEIAESKKLKNFIKNNLSLKPMESPSDEVSKAMKAKNLREVGRTNKDGTISTVLMQSAEIDGKFVAYPTLFPKDPDAYTSRYMSWMELDGMDAYNKAIERDEVFVFDTDEEAQRFAEGGWKNISTHDAEAKAFYDERGRDYQREKAIADEYEQVKGMLDFLETAPRLLSDVPEGQRDGVSNLYINGRLRSDYGTIEKELNARYEELKDDYLDDEAELIREDFDLRLQKKFRESAGDAVRVNNIAKQNLDEVEKQSLLAFGVKPNQLNSVVPVNETETAMKKQLQQRYVDALANSEKAADVRL